VKSPLHLGEATNAVRQNMPQLCSLARKRPQLWHRN